MYWFSRPPFARYAAAVLIVLIAMWVELRPDDTTLHPFAADDLPAGAPLADSDIRWVPVPEGLLPPVDETGTIERRVAAGEPLLPSMLATSAPAIPDDWWTLEIDLPADVVPGQAVQLVVLSDPGLPPVDPIPAVVAAAGTAGGALSGGASGGRIAVPPELAAAAAVAVAGDRVTVLIGGLG